MGIQRFSYTAATLALASVASADPLCGAPGLLPNNIFRSGFENELVLKPAKSTSATVKSAKGSVALVVASPLENAVVAEPMIPVYGTFSGPALTGVAVNANPALAHNANYLQFVRLKPGANQIIVRATALDGTSQQVTRTVTFNPSAVPDAILEAPMTGDYAPFSLRFSVAVKPGIINNVIQRIRIDYNGDGSFDVDTTNANQRLVARYALPGSYTAAAEVTLDDGNAGTPPLVVQSTRRVIAENLDSTRSSLCATFEHLRNNVATQQYSIALQAINSEVRPEYASFFQGLGGNGATVASSLGEIADGSIGQTQATLVLSRPSNAAGTFNAFDVQMSRESDGVWRITGL
jgi:hypothetical protein